METEKKAVLVTTEKKGVFFGLLEDDTKLPEAITLSECRMCVYWARSVRGVLGLAAAGPNEECRITRAAPQSTLYGITGVFACTPEAVKAWRAQPWNN